MGLHMPGPSFIARKGMFTNCPQRELVESMSRALINRNLIHNKLKNKSIEILMEIGIIPRNVNRLILGLKGNEPEVHVKIDDYKEVNGSIDILILLRDNGKKTRMFVIEVKTTNRNILVIDENEKEQLRDYTLLLESLIVLSKKGNIKTDNTHVIISYNDIEMLLKTNHLEEMERLLPDIEEVNAYLVKFQLYRKKSKLSSCNNVVDCIRRILLSKIETPRLSFEIINKLRELVVSYHNINEADKRNYYVIGYDCNICIRNPLNAKNMTDKSISLCPIFIGNS